MNDLISIIVPVYNVEKYLRRCIESLLIQSYSDLEIILIDDGSTDSSAQICDDYKKKDFRIQVIHKKNGGASSARNQGVINASGKFICFVDSDDFLPSDAIMKLYSATKSDAKRKLIVGMCGYTKGRRVKKYIPKKKIIKMDTDIREVFRYITESGSYSPYAKLYETKILLDNHVFFREDMKIAEDTVFVRNYLKYCEQIFLIPEIVYRYNRENPSSLSKKAYPDYCIFFAEKMRSVEELLKALNVEKRQKELFLTQRAVHGIRLCINHYLKNWENEIDRKELIKNSIDVLSQWLFLEDLNKTDRNYRWWRRYGEFFKNKDVPSFYNKMMEDNKNKINRLKNIISLIRYGKRE